MEKESFLGAVYMIIKNEKGEILFGRRIGTKLWCGYSGLPAGHIDKGEDAYEALFREAKEELDIEISYEDIIDIFVVNRRNKTLSPYFDIYFEIKSYKGEIKINEVDKCQEFKWCDLNNLPDDVIDYQKVALENNLKGIKFSSIKVDNK